MAKDLELMLEELFYKTDGIIGEKLLRENLKISFLKKLEEDSILEGRGMSFRASGDVFQNEQGKTLTFSNAIILPEGGGSFPEKEDASKEVARIVKKQKITLEKTVNPPNKAAMIVVFTDETNKKVGFVKYFASTPADGKEKWAEKNFKIDTGYYRSAKDGKVSTSTLESLPIKPSDLVSDDIVRNTKQLQTHVLNKAKAFVTSGAMSQDIYNHIELLLDAAVNNKPSPKLDNGGQYAAAYDKYLGEILAPISLVSGWLSTGDRDESEKILLPGKKYGSLKISFNINPNEKMVDSKVIHTDGTEVKISSKADTGAASTISTFNDILENVKETDEKGYNDFLRDHELLSNTIKIVASNDWYDGPVKLAKNIGLIDDTDFAVLQKIKASGRINLPTFKKTIRLTARLKEISKSFKGISPDKITQPEPGYEPIFHVISGIAKQVVLKINADPAFDKGIRLLLSKSNMVQINSKIKLLGDKKADCQFEKFEVRYPPIFKGTIKLDSSKNYSSTRIRGKISFKIV